ncbi:hypothetical protein EKPJFOCH_3469 [Methylobacterium thuringiense]|uniref:Anti-sigma factor NepR domain-containing protein n=2 Tax=Methylobacterium thuringiense TaxID=1003091 RepID=A0ABQ4TRF1_9HYPH|nr:hypothetical protein EKPJFOCH_3469 [Methylobacterium thuringiense]
MPVLDAGHDSLGSDFRADTVPLLDASTRERLGQQLQAMYEPVFDRAIGPHLIEVLQQLDRDRKE